MKTKLSPEQAEHLKSLATQPDDTID